MDDSSSRELTNPRFLQAHPEYIYNSLTSYHLQGDSYVRDTSTNPRLLGRWLVRGAWFYKQKTVLLAITASVILIFVVCFLMFRANWTKSGLTEDEKSQFLYESLRPVESDAKGSYPPFHWKGQNWLRRWNAILDAQNSFSTKLPFPPFTLNEENGDKIVVVMFGRRYQDEFQIYGAFHSNVAVNVSAFNVQMEMNLAFVKKDNTEWTADKRIIIPLQHEHYHISKPSYHSDLLFKLYNVPFASLSSSSTPTLKKISITRGSPEHLKWFYWGLAPRISRNGRFDTIDCSSLSGTYDCAREWLKMKENGTLNDAQLHLPPLILSRNGVEDAALCMVVSTHDNDHFHFDTEFHPFKPENIIFNEILLTVNVTVQMVTGKYELRILPENGGIRSATSNGRQFPPLSSSDPPLFTISILSAN